MNGQQPPPPEAGTRAAYWLCVQTASQIGQGFERALIDDETIKNNERLLAAARDIEQAIAMFAKMIIEEEMKVQ